MEGNKVVITGGEGDLACVIAVHLANHGFEIDAPGRDELDVTHDDQVRRYFTQHHPDLLICNAGMTRDRSFGRLTEEDWDDVLDVNLRGVIRCSREAIKSMKERGGGSIVLLSSYSAIRPPHGQCAYATSKAALHGLVQEIAREHGKHDIRVNAIMPGFLETKMTESVRSQRKQEVLREHTLERLNTPEKVAEFIGFLHLNMRHTSGQIFQLDSRIS